MAERFSLLVIIKKKTNSRELYSKLERYKMNVADLGDQTLVYNFELVTVNDVMMTLIECCKYGKCEVLLTVSAGHQPS